MKFFLTLIVIILMQSCSDHVSQSHAEHKKDSTTTKNNSDTAQMSNIMDDMMQKMHAVSTSNNPDRDFAVLMKAHHIGAVEMAKLQIAQGKDTAMINMAQQILADQNKEIDLFTNYLNRKPTSIKNGDAFYNESMGEMHKMHMDIDPSGGIDVQFVKNMIPHHQGAVDMAKVYLKYAKDAQLKTLAQSIITSQEKEIMVFQNWLQTNGAGATLQD